ncbi:MAG: tRNA epoxyqueuosine(34) reductase QueG [Woeseiaceae bacterium]|nr:tRNA epoxyqueuosine(34) reductase QueG [Woeseiaceae bacterium]
MTTINSIDYHELKSRILAWGNELGFQQVGISDVDLGTAESRLREWIDAGYHGTMNYMHKHGPKRSRPEKLVPGTLRIISVRMDYLPEAQASTKELLDHPSKAYLSRYALGRDYHKVLRGRLKALARKIEDEIGAFGYRLFVDSAPVLEKAIAEKAGIGWIGKHTNVINKDAGSWFFLGELYTDLPLAVDDVASDHCGSCRACIDVCPTKAIIAPYQLDSRRCISYLTIESSEPIPVEFRTMMGNRIYGCDDCQLFCPWNKFAHATAEGDFAPRHSLDDCDLVELFNWDEATWLARTEGSAIRRIGYLRWLRNIAVALGNAATTPGVIAALEQRRNTDSELVREHVLWALSQHDTGRNERTDQTAKAEQQRPGD